ncbi:MAG TPA: glycosyltransferase family 39 protein [Methylomirabilota bacterium]|nr:glycosyltransferase family 39 protein [Methylomirabilota bacterium]
MRSPCARQLCLVGGAALVVHAAWAAALADRHPRFDETAYIAHAEQLARGAGFVDAGGLPATYWPVGYPAALALAYRVGGEGYPAAASLNVIAASVTAMLTYLCAVTHFGRAVGVIAGLVVAIYPNHVFYTSLHLTEPLFTLLLLAAAWCLLRSGPRTRPFLLAAGLLFGVATLIRPAIALFPLALPIWFRQRATPARAALGHAGIVIGTMVLVVMPWVVRNHRVSGHWELASSGGHNFWIGNNPKALGGYVHDRATNAALSSGGTREFSRGYRLGLQTIANDPARAALRCLQKVSYFVALETDGLLWNVKGLERPWPMWVLASALSVANAAYVVVFGAWLLGAVVGRRPALTSLSLLLAAYLALIVLVFLGDPRYHYPLVPLAAIVGTATVLRDGRELWRGRRALPRPARIRVLRWAAAMCLVAVLAGANLYLKSLEASVFSP